MLPPEPRPTRFDLHWRMLGADVRIRPLFWFSCILWGIVYYQDPQIGGLTMFALWIAGVFISLAAHDLGHLLAARRFGVSPRLVLTGLGGQVFGLNDLSRGKRVLIALAGPLMNALLFALAWPIPEFPSLLQGLGAEAREYVANGLAMFLMINAIWCLLNLLPLWPLDGGFIAVEIGEGLLGKRGRIAALLLSLAVCVLLLISAVVWMRVNLSDRFNPRFRVYLIFFCILSIYCYALWLSVFRALWGDSGPPDETTRSERAA